MAQVRQMTATADLDAPDATDQQLRELEEKTERYCVVLQTLVDPPPIEAARDA